MVFLKPTPSLTSEELINNGLKSSLLDFQCSKALVRSGLWDADNQMSPNDVPSAGQMLEATAADDFDALEYDRTSERRNKDQLW